MYSSYVPYTSWTTTVLSGSACGRFAAVCADVMTRLTSRISIFVDLQSSTKSFRFSSTITCVLRIRSQSTVGPVPGHLSVFLIVKCFHVRNARSESFRVNLWRVDAVFSVCHRKTVLDKISARAGRSGDRILMGVRFPAPVQTGPRAHPVSYTMSTGCFPGVNRPGRGVDHSPQFSAEVNPYPTAFPYGNGMVLHFYQQQESSTTKTVHKVINKGLKAYV